MGVFEFIVALVLISTVGKVASRRFSRERPRGEIPQVGPGEIEHLREAMDDLNGRVMRLEEERDFYKELLESPERQRELLPPRKGHDSSDTEDGSVSPA